MTAVAGPPTLAGDQHAEQRPGDAARPRPGLLRTVLRNPGGAVGGTLLVIVVLLAVLAPVLAQQGPNTTHLSLVFQRPGTVGFPLGTDDLGRDILARVLFGIRTSLEVGLMSVVLATVVGTALGLLAGYWRAADLVVSRLIDTTLAFPFIITAVALTAMYGASEVNAAIAIGIAQIPVMARIVRAETLRVKVLEFVAAARAMNASEMRILLRHVLPGTGSAIIVQATLVVPIAVIGEALLSYLGLGTQPPTPSLGVMLADAQDYISRDPTAAIFPGIAIAMICLAFNLLGDAFNDALEPAAAIWRPGRRRTERAAKAKRRSRS